MPTCSVMVCKNTSTKVNYVKDGISFHTYPRYPNIKEQWINATGKPPHWFPTKTSTICSAHFEKDMFMAYANKRKLQEWAIPTLKTRLVFENASKDNATPSCSYQQCNVSAGATSSPIPDPAQMPSDSYHHEVLSATQSLTLPVANIKKESSDEDSRSSFNAEPSGVEDLQHEVSVKMEDECSDDEKDISLKQTIRDIATQLSALKDNDSFDAFGRYVASVMRSLPLHRAMAVQPKIVNLLVEAVSGPDDTPQ